jgi:hypothetical protein
MSEGLQLTQSQVKSVNILIAAAGVAQKKGAYSLEDAKVVFEAIQDLVPRPEPQQDEEVGSD